MTPLGRRAASAPHALSVWPSYATGLGAAVTLDHRVHVGPTGPRARGPVEPILAATAVQLGVARGAVAKLRARFTLPRGVGLKSSSALAVAGAVSLGAPALAIEELLRVAAGAEVSCGATQAGSVDDRVAVAVGGFVAVDTLRRAVIARGPAPGDDLVVIVHVPHARRWPCHALDRRELLRPHRRRVESIVAAWANSGDLFAAMTASARIHVRALGYPDDADALLRAGGVAVALSGKGPARAVITPPSRAAAVAAELLREGGEVFQTRFASVGVTADA